MFSNGFLFVDCEGLTNFDDSFYTIFLN